LRHTWQAGYSRESDSAADYLRLEIGWPRRSYIARSISIVTLFAGIPWRFRTLAFSLALWAALMGAGQLRQPFLDIVGQLGGFLGRFRRCSAAIAMVMVLFENERNAVQDNGWNSQPWASIRDACSPHPT